MSKLQYTQKTLPTPIPANEFGKLPPQALELEEDVLGALMIEREAYQLVSDFLKPEYFYKTAHQKIFEAIRQLANSNKPVDMLTVTEQLRKDGTLDDVGGPYYITLLTARVSTSAHLEYHASIVHQKYLSRELIRLSFEIQTKAFDENMDVDDLITYANKCFSDIANFDSSSILSMYDACDLMYKNIIQNSSDAVLSSGSLTGFNTFDKRSGGLQKSDLIVIAGESSHGKTSLALSIVNNISKNGGKIAIYSMEMRAIQLAARFTSIETGIPANEILYSKFDKIRFEQLDRKINRLLNSEIYIDEKSTSNLESIVSSIRGMVKNYKIEGAVVDYIQLVHVGEKGLNREQQTAIIARTLKNLAKDLNIWIIALSQFARDNSNPEPSIKRLRDSGQIEEACDVCMLIYRPEQVGRKTFPEPFKNSTLDVEGKAFVDIAKGRNIGTFKFLTNFDKHTTHFTDMNEPDYQYDYTGNEQIDDDTKDPW